jgi:hypothetical protein
MLTLGVLITLAGIQFQTVSVMLIGTVVGGTGFGTVFSGTLQSVLAYAQQGERAGLLSAYFVEGYLAFSIPALAAGFLSSPCRPDADRRLLRRRRHPAGDQYTHRQPSAATADVVTNRNSPSGHSRPKAARLLK